MPALAVRRESWPLAGVFRISRGARSVAETVLVEIRDRDAAGRGECVPYSRYGETVESVVESVEALRGDIEAGLTREALAGAMGPGAARNAIDCALWDLEAKRAGRRAWETAPGFAAPAPEPVVTAYTLGIDEPGAMREAAARHAARPLLKVKLGGDRITERVAAVRAGAPGARLIVDANEAWTAETLHARLPELAGLGVELIEQPLPAGADAALADIERAVPVAADESCHTRAPICRGSRAATTSSTSSSTRRGGSPRPWPCATRRPPPGSGSWWAACSRRRSRWRPRSSSPGGPASWTSTAPSSSPATASPASTTTPTAGSTRLPPPSGADPRSTLRSGCGRRTARQPKPVPIRRVEHLNP